jgi:nucleoid-associated protein YgaU
MSIISFMKDAGERLFKRPPLPTPPSVSRSVAPPKATLPDLAALDRSAADAIKRYVASKGLPAKDLDIKLDGETSTVTVSGQVTDQATREKIVVCCGNVASVQHVNDQMTVVHTGEQSGGYYTVKKGDTLSKIAKDQYGSASGYSAIFEANKPMLNDPDKIYPGQVLRIPRLS